MRIYTFAVTAACLMVTSSAWAQKISGNFANGSVRIGNDTGTCDAARYGAIRFNTNKFQGCSTGGWVDIGTFGGSSSVWQSGGGGSIYYSSGNVGIGTSTTLTALTLSGELYTGTNSAMYGNAYWNGSSFAYGGNGVAGIMKLANNTLGGISFETLPTNASGAGATAASTSRLFISANTGNVGIGTATPSDLLNVYRSGEGNAGLTLSSNAGSRVALTPNRGAGGSNPLTQAGDATLIFHSGAVDTGTLVIGQWSNSARGFRIDSNGNVGIGTSSPSTPLQVNGTATATLFSGSGASLTNLNASNISSGTVPTARLGSGTANGTTYLRGDGTWAAAGGADNLGVGGTTTGNIILNNASPTISLQDTDHRTGFIHQNSDYMYFLSSAGANAGGWTINGSYWPLTLNMATDAATFGGPAYFMEGNVGIGTSSPQARLDVSHTGSAVAGGIRIGDPVTIGNNTGIYGRTSGVFTVGAAGGDIVLDTNYGSAERVRIQHATGNVGVGSAPTGYRLTVGGDVYANGGWLRTAGSAGWYSESYGGGWYMADTTWLRAYNDKWIYTAGGLRADSQIRTPWICDINGANCVAQNALGSGGSVPSGTHCGERIMRCDGPGTLAYHDAAVPNYSSYIYHSGTNIACNGTNITASGCSGWNLQGLSCPSGYNGRFELMHGADGDGVYGGVFFYRTYCVKN